MDVRAGAEDGERLHFLPTGGGEVERGRGRVRRAVRPDATVAPWLGEDPVEAVGAVIELVHERVPRRLAPGAPAHFLDHDCIPARLEPGFSTQHADDERRRPAAAHAADESRERARPVGYAVVIQEVRGRAGSEAAWHPFVHELEDGADCLDWILAQPWCDGRIGTYGTAYSASTALYVSALGRTK